MTTLAPETTATPFNPPSQSSLASPACVAAWDLAKQSLRMAVFAQYDNARAMHAATASAAVRRMRSLSGAR